MQPRVLVTLDELLVDERALGSGEDVEAAVRAALEEQRAPVDATRVAAEVRAAVAAEAES